MGWNRVGEIGNGVKIHFATDATAQLLAEDLEKRFEGPFPVVPLDGPMWFKVGHIGLYFSGQPSIVVYVNGLSFEIDCRQVSDFVVDLREPAKRQFSDGTLYVKLYNSNQCLVLSEDEREELYNQLVEVEEECSQAYLDFMDEVIAKMEERRKHENHD